MEEVLMGGSGWVAEARRVVVLVVAVLPLAAVGLALVVAPAAQATTLAAHGSVLITSAGASLAPPATRARTGQAASSIRPARSQSPAAGLCPVVVSLSESPSATFYGFEGAEKFTSHVSVPKSDFCKALPTGSVTISADSTTVCTIEMSGSVSGVDYCYLPTSTFLGVGTYIVTASYSGDWEYSSGTNSGTEVSLSVSEQTTTTSLALSSPGAVYSQEGSEELSVQVTPQSEGTATGTVVVSASGPTSGTLCTLALSSGSAHCNLTASQLAAGSYSLTATYSGGDPDFAGSTSAAQSLYVGSDATYFVTFNVPGTGIYGSEEHQTFSATVTAVSGTPTGTVAITDSAGTPLCSFTLSAAAAGSGSCSPTNPIAEVPGNYSVIATFYADAPYVGSVAPSTPWSVAKAHGYPSLSVSASSASYGNEHSVVFSVKVAPEFTNEGTPTGTVTVEDTNNDVLCTVTLVAAAGSCSTQNTPAGDTALSVGSYQLFASYHGDSNFSGTDSGESPQSFSVSQASTTTGLTLSSSTVTSGHENAERLKVQVKSHYPVALVGQITIIGKAAHHKAAIVCVVTLNSGKGSCKLKAKALRPGTYELTATYGGSADILTSTSPKKKLTVRK
jgi:large repetitive protein